MRPNEIYPKAGEISMYGRDQAFKSDFMPIMHRDYRLVADTSAAGFNKLASWLQAGTFLLGTVLVMDIHEDISRARNYPYTAMSPVETLLTVIVATGAYASTFALQHRKQELKQNIQQRNSMESATRRPED